MEAKGRGFLKVCGILMIIGGAISIVVSIIGLIGGGLAGAAAGALAEEGYEEIAAAAAQGGGLLTVGSIIALIGGVVELITGIIGVKNCGNPEKATTCIVWGIIVLVLSIISIILTLIGGNVQAGSLIVSIICSLVLPVLYLIGAFKNKQA